MAAAQQIAFRMTVDTSSAKADLSQIANEFARFVDRITSGASQLEAAKLKASAGADAAKAKAAASAKEVSESYKSVATSIEGGQSLLTSLVGEGAKLVSDLGGIGSAASAVGGYIKSIATPLNLATKAVTLLTEAYVEGSKEAVAYANAKTMTGNYVGLTSEQLQTKAVDIAGTQGTKSRAAEAITAVVNTGRISGDVVSEVAGATAEMNRVLGTSINETVGNFVKLADEPSKASAKLNETYHYLNASTYERIVALEKQGKKEDAAALAQTAYATAMKQRAAEVVGNLGSIQRAWLSLTGVAQRAWDSMLNIGRPETTQQKIAEVDKKIGLIDALEPGNGFAVNGEGAAFGRPKSSTNRNSERNALLEQKAALTEVDLMARKSAMLQGQRARAEQAAVTKSIEENEKKKDEVSNSGKGASGIRQAEDDGLRARVDALREEYNTKARDTAEGLKQIDSLRKRDLLTDYDVVRRKRELRLDDLKNQQDAVQEELRLVGSRKGSAGDTQRLESRSKEIEQQRGFVNTDADRSNMELDAGLQNAVLKTSQQATEKIREQVRAQEEQNAAYGLSKEAILQLNIAQTQRQISELDATENVSPAYIQSLRDRLSAEQALLNLTQTGDRRKTTDEKKKTEKDEAEKASKKMADDIGGVFRDGFVNLLEGGGRDAIDKIGEGLKKKLVKSLADAFYDATLKDAVEGFSKWMTGALRNSVSGESGSASGGAGLSGLGGIFGAVSSLFGGFSGSAAASVANVVGGSDTLGTMIGLMGLTKSANGNVFASPGLHAYANSVVGKPTFFPFADGIGLMGEAGPEAIMPLRRGSDGRLGVSAQGSGGNGSLHYAPSSVFYIDSRSDRGAVLADLDRALQANNKGQMEHLKRLRVVPQ
jgi:phage-related minor tail protein